MIMSSENGADLVPAWQDMVVSAEGAPVYAKRRLGTGVPTVFLHGYGDYADCWLGLVNRLPTALDVTLVDSIGHGHSGYPKSGCDAVARRDSVIALLEANIGAAILIGHSMGAATALAVAAARPDLVRGLVLEDPPWWANDVNQEPVVAFTIGRDQPMVQWIEGLQRSTVADVTASCRGGHPDWDEIEFVHWARSKLRVDLSGVDLPYRDIPESVCAQWAKVACPTLLFTGDPSKSAIVTDVLARDFLAAVPTAQRSHHASVGHDIRRDDPAGVSAAITQFLASLDTPAEASA